MTAPRKPPEYPPGFVPLRELAVLRSPASWELLVPSTTYTALDAAEQAKADLADVKEDEPESRSAEPPTIEAPEVVPARRRARARHIHVFAQQELEQAGANLQTADRHQQKYAKALLEQAGTNDGYRVLPRIQPALKKLDEAHSLLGNLREPIQKLKIDLTLAAAMRAKDFRLRPILLTGEPGVGKTQFALKLAEMLGVPMQTWSAGSSQANFQLTGGDSAWRNARPGMIFDMLAKGSAATPVGDALSYVFDREYSIFNQTRLMAEAGYRGKYRNVQSDKQSLETTFEFGHLLQDICDGLTIDVLWGPLPASIPLRGARELRRYSGLMPAEYRNWKLGSKPNYERPTAYENDLSLRTRYPLANLRVVAELLMFIGQTGMNLAQAHRLELRHFFYASDVDGYKVRDYKQRRGGEVLFEIYREYRGHFERYLDWRRSVFPDEVRLFPFPQRKSHENMPPSLETIKRACIETGIKWVSPSTLRSTRVNWLLRRSGDADLTAEMAQHRKQTLLRNYEKPSHQVAIAEITRFWKKADPHLTTSTQVASIAAGVCDGKPEVVSFKPQSAPAPDCLHPSGCLWCAHHRDIDSFGYVWALACFRHLKTIEAARYCPPTGMTSRHPADHAIERISEKLAWFRDSNAVRSGWVTESMARIDEGSYHSDWLHLINDVDGVTQ